jgi:flagellar biosynthesis/type III secretory pathway chaperone
MNARASVQTFASQPGIDDERALLIRLELLLEREEELLAARDADGLTAVAEEREQICARLAVAARLRATKPLDAASEAALLAHYERLRQRHDVQARIVRLHTERNTRAVGVLAQATGQGSLYNAEGRVAMKFAAG